MRWIWDGDWGDMRPKIVISWRVLYFLLSLWVDLGLTSIKI